MSLIDRMNVFTLTIVFPLSEKEIDMGDRNDFYPDMYLPLQSLFHLNLSRWPYSHGFIVRFGRKIVTCFENCQTAIKWN